VARSCVEDAFDDRFTTLPLAERIAHRAYAGLVNRSRLALVLCSPSQLHWTAD